MAFRKAEKKRAKLRLALMGTSGSGKTYSALLIATGLVEKEGGNIALIDTESGSGELYSDKFDYDIDYIKPPFEPQKYIDKIKEAENAGYTIIIIDSLSHAWAGDGGMLDIHSKVTQSTYNSFTAWREVTPLHNMLIDTMLQSPVHIITTCRSKTAYEIQDNEKGKKVPIKIGLAPIFREGLEFEMTVTFEISVNKHTAHSSKDRTSLFDGKYFVPDKKIGHELYEWLNSGKDVWTFKQKSEINELLKAKGISEQRDRLDFIVKYKEKNNITDDLTSKDASKLINNFNSIYDDLMTVFAPEPEEPTQAPVSTKTDVKEDKITDDQKNRIVKLANSFADFGEVEFYTKTLGETPINEFSKKQAGAIIGKLKAKIDKLDKQNGENK